MTALAARHVFARRAATAIILALAATLLAIPTARAEMTPWATNEGGRMRLLALPPASDGTVRGGLQIEPNPGWMTYWKEPGDAGIPPQLILSPDGGVSLKRFAYPIPKRIDSGDLRDIGYDHSVILPFELAVEDRDKPAKLGVSAFVGLCRNICIPFQADFALEFGQNSPSSMEEAMLLAAAETKLPEGPSKEFAVTGHSLLGSDVLRLKLRLPSTAAVPPQVIVTGPEGHVFFESRNEERKGDSYALDIPIEKLPKDYEISGKHWGVLVIAGDRAMETSLAFD